MRVYGSSPLYNYVELVFRSKRLFIASIVLTTLAVASVAAMKAGTYTATALVVLSGSAGTTSDDEQAGLRGSIKYKLNLLNVYTKDPEFFKTAFKEEGLDKGRTDEQFTDFVHDARQALQFRQGENVLEVACTWKDQECEKIVNAFYGEYSRRVLSQESITSSTTSRTLKLLLDEYTSKVKNQENKITKFREGVVGKNYMDPGTANADYLRQKERVETLQSQLNITKTALEEVRRQLVGTDRNIIDVVDYDSMSRDPRFAALVERQTEAQKNLDSLKLKYTDEHPMVKQAQQQVDNLKASMERILHQDKKTAQVPNRSRKTTNVIWLQLDAKRSDYEIAVQSLQEQLAGAILDKDRAFAQAKSAPKDVSDYRWMTDQNTLFNSIRENLKSKMEQAIIDEKKERELHLTEMSMMVKPEAEKDTAGSKTMLFYAVGPILGAIIAFAFSLLSETLDHSLRTPIEVEKYLGKPVLAVLPRMNTPKATRGQIGGGGDASRTISST